MTIVSTFIVLQNGATQRPVIEALRVEWIKIEIACTVKLVNKDPPLDQRNVVLIPKWSL